MKRYKKYFPDWDCPSDFFVADEGKYWKDVSEKHEPNPAWARTFKNYTLQVFVVSASDHKDEDVKTYNVLLVGHDMWLCFDTFAEVSDLILMLHAVSDLSQRGA